MLQTLFWLSLTCVLYAYVGYPAVLALVARWRARPLRDAQAPTPSISIVMAAYNEEENIGRRVREFRGMLDRWPAPGEILVVSDGSTDRTCDVVRSEPAESVLLIELPENRGKAHALDAAARLARHDILVLADTRQRWAPDALDHLVAAFGDPEVGAVSGDLTLEAADGTLAGVGLYWKLEKRIRQWESRFDSCVGVTGSISAVRRDLFPTIPPGTVLDDVYWPLRVVMSGSRVVHVPGARAFDRLPEKVSGEFGRKVRTLSGNYQLLRLLPEAILPWRNRLCWQFISHKISRLAAPWALLVALFTSALLGGWPYRVAFLIQVAFYLFAASGTPARSLRPPFASAAAAFVLLNTAAALALLVSLRRHTSRTWKKVRYG